MESFKLAKLYGRMAAERRALYYLTPGVETCRLEFADDCAIIAMRYLARAKAERQGMDIHGAMMAAEEASDRVLRTRYERRRR